MGMDFIGDGRSFRLSNSGWILIFNLACDYEWVPSGTTIDSLQTGIAESDWNGGYHSNDGQMVDDQDAMGLAVALEKALAEMPDEKIDNGWGGPEEKAMVRDFIAFCSKSGFMIL